MARSKKTDDACADLTVRLDLNSVLTAPSSTVIHLDQLASMANRRMYQQGRNWHVSGVTVWCKDIGDDAAFVKFGTLPDTWTVRQAYKRGRKAWFEMIRDATRTDPDFVMPKWSDYKVAMYTQHQLGDQGEGIYRPNWELVDMYNKHYYWSDIKSDYEYSTYASMTSDDDETDEFRAAMLGDHDGNQGDYDGYIGLIRSYNDTLQPVKDPNPAEMLEAKDPILGLLQSHQFAEDVIEEVQTEGDNPPYAPLDEAYGTGRNPANASNSIVAATTCLDSNTNIVGRTQGFKAPLGMVEIQVDPLSVGFGGSNDLFVTFHMTPGDTRGYHTTAIQ